MDPEPTKNGPVPQLELLNRYRSTLSLCGSAIRCWQAKNGRFQRFELNIDVHFGFSSGSGSEVPCVAVMLWMFLHPAMSAAFLSGKRWVFPATTGIKGAQRAASDAPSGRSGSSSWPDPPPWPSWGPSASTQSGSGGATRSSGPSGSTRLELVFFLVFNNT